MGGRSEAVVEFRTYVDTCQAATRGYEKQRMASFRKEEGFRSVTSGKVAVTSVTAMMHTIEEVYCM